MPQRVTIESESDEEQLDVFFFFETSLLISFNSDDSMSEPDDQSFITSGLDSKGSHRMMLA